MRSRSSIRVPAALLPAAPFVAGGFVGSFDSVGSDFDSSPDRCARASSGGRSLSLGWRCPTGACIGALWGALWIEGCDAAGGACACCARAAVVAIVRIAVGIAINIAGTRMTNLQAFSGEKAVLQVANVWIDGVFRNHVGTGRARSASAVRSTSSPAQVMLNALDA